MLPRLVLRLCTHNFKMITDSNIDSPIFSLIKAASKWCLKQSHQIVAII